MFDLIAYVGNSGKIVGSGLKNADTGAYVNDATMTVEILTRDGVALTGFTNPISMQYVADSNGDYAGALPYDAPLVADKTYTGKLIAESAGARLSMTVRIFARNRF